MPNWASSLRTGSLLKGAFAGAILLAGSLGSVAFAQNPRVILETSKGDIEVELFEKEAPVTVANFLSYVKKGHYDGTIFHRVISDFVVQGGGLTVDMKEKPTSDPIENEAGNGLKNERMTLSMARTSAPHTRLPSSTSTSNTIVPWIANTPKTTMATASLAKWSRVKKSSIR